MESEKTDQSGKSPEQTKTPAENYAEHFRMRSYGVNFPKKPEKQEAEKPAKAKPKKEKVENGN